MTIMKPVVIWNKIIFFKFAVASGVSSLTEAVVVSVVVDAFSFTVVADVVAVFAFVFVEFAQIATKAGVAFTLPPGCSNGRVQLAPAANTVRPIGARIRTEISRRSTKLYHSP